MPRLSTGRSITEVLSRLSERNVRKAIIPAAALVVQKLVKRQFSQQRDPYGKRWKRKQESDGRPVLTGKTRQLRRNINKLTSRTGFGLKAATPYASFHQDGTRDLPQRKIFPDFANLPRSWKAALRPIVTKAITKLIR